MPAKTLFRAVQKEAFAHIYNKGIEDRLIFNEDADFKTFIRYLKEYLNSPADTESTKKVFTVKGKTFRGTPHQPKNYFNQVRLIAYSLMPNHFHLILYQNKEKAIEKFIRSLCTRYSMYYNKKYKRAGALFEGPYKSAYIVDIANLTPLSMYIHQHSNYSSLPEYLGQKKTDWISPRIVLVSLKDGSDSYKKLINEFTYDIKERELLKDIVLEKESHLLERRDLKSTTVLPSKDASNESIKYALRTPEVFIITTIFVLLTTIGLKNIESQPNVKFKLSSYLSSLVLRVRSIATTQKLEPTTSMTETKEIPDQNSELTMNYIPPHASNSENLSDTNLVASNSALTVSGTTAVLPASTSEPTNKFVVVKITDGSPSANVRKDSTIYSEKVGVVYNGETFELVSEKSKWYEVKLPNGLTGFISPKYAHLEEGETD